MGKDMHDHLQWLEDELFQEEDLTALEEEQDDDLDFDLDDIIGEFLEEEETPRPVRNRAVDFDRMAFGDEDFQESTAVLVSRKKNKETKNAPKKKGIGGLVFLAVLEVIAIIAVLLRWALWFL